MILLSKRKGQNEKGHKPYGLYPEEKLLETPRSGGEQGTTCLKGDILVVRTADNELINGRPDTTGVIRSGSGLVRSLVVGIPKDYTEHIKSVLNKQKLLLKYIRMEQ